jgi:flagellin-like protein
MRRFRSSERGLSEIVGTLMLVVIVVTAATLLAAFVATYQKQLQTEQAFTHDQNLESLKILGLETSLNRAGTAYRNINFTLASEYINPSIILGISINNFPLVSIWWEDLTTHVWSQNPLGSNLSLGPQQEIFVSTNTSSSNNSFLVAPPPPSQYLKFDVDTVLQNDFSRVFLPPTAFGVVSEINPSGSNPITLLDGSQSFQPGGNASLVEWNWTVSGGGLGTPESFSGEEVEVSPALAVNHTYSVLLVVANSDGLLGSTTLSYTAP